MIKLSQPHCRSKLVPNDFLFQNLFDSSDSSHSETLNDTELKGALKVSGTDCNIMMFQTFASHQEHNLIELRHYLEQCLLHNPKVYFFKKISLLLVDFLKSLH